MPRTRFAPVKTTDDLLVLRSDVYEVADDMDVTPVNGGGGSLPYVELDKRFYRLTPLGRKQLEAELAEYSRMHEAIQAVLRTA